jgi:hypothetical protein
MFWNSQSLKSKISELSKFLNVHKPHIILLSETWLNEKVHIKIPNYIIYRNDRVSDSQYPHGGVAIAVANNVDHYFVKIRDTKNIECIFIKITNNNNTLSIGSVYCPPAINTSQFENDMRKLLSIPGQVLLAGDFNAKHVSWNNFKNCNKGKALIQLCSNHSFSINSPDYPTLFPSVGKPSTVDLALSKCLSGISNLKVINDLSSDHLPILFDISSFKSISSKNQIFDYSRANWKLFREEILLNLNFNDCIQSDLDSTKKIDDYIEDLNELVLKSANRHIPLKNAYYFRYPHSQSIEILKKNRNHYRNLYKRTNNNAFKSMTNQLNKMIKHETTTLNQSEFDKKLATLSVNDNSLHTFTRSIKQKKIKYSST